MSSTIFITNLNFSTNASEIKSFFEQIGNVTDVKVLENSQGKSKGGAYVTFDTVESAHKAFQLFNYKESIGKNVKAELTPIETKPENFDLIKHIVNQELKTVKKVNSKIFDEFNEKIANSDKKIIELEKKIVEIDTEKQQKISNMMKEINYLKFEVNPYHFFLIPNDVKWIVETSLKYSYFGIDKSITVTVSDICGDISNHYGYYLFNGKMENQDGKRWATGENQKTAFILITFDKAYAANVIYMGSRDYWFAESPNSFELFGIDSSGNNYILHKRENVKWDKNEKKFFYFENSVKYISYKIVFYSCNMSTYIYGLAEFNLGYIP